MLGVYSYEELIERFERCDCLDSPCTYYKKDMQVPSADIPDVMVTMPDVPLCSGECDDAMARCIPVNDKGASILGLIEGAGVNSDTVHQYIDFFKRCDCPRTECEQIMGTVGISTNPDDPMMLEDKETTLCTTECPDGTKCLPYAEDGTPLSSLLVAPITPEMFEKYHELMTNGGVCKCEEQTRCSKIFVLSSTGQRRPLCVGDCPADSNTKCVALDFEGNMLNPLHPEFNDILTESECGCPDCHPTSYTADQQVEKCSETVCPTIVVNGEDVKQRCLPVTSKLAPKPDFKDTCDCVPVTTTIIKDPVVIDVKPIEGKQ
jgi:hypothetical protein